jgi:tetratricopeptide (TPR) repeat protein
MPLAGSAAEGSAQPIRGEQGCNLERSTADPAARPDAASTLGEALESLLAVADACAVSAHFQAYLGAVLLSLQRYAEAATALEKALLLDPELAGAQLDYAQALARMGQREVAIGLVAQVAERQDIEPGLRALLQEEANQARDNAGRTARQVEGLAGQPELSRLAGTGRIRWTGLMQASIGGETNLNSVTHTREITLYLLSGPVNVELAESGRPKSGPTSRLAGALQAELDAGFGLLRGSATAQTRLGFSDVVARQFFHRLDMSLTRSVGHGSLQWALARQEFRQGDLFAARDASGLIEYLSSDRVGVCRGAGALGLTDQRYPLLEIMAGTYRFVRAELRCAAGGEWRVGVVGGRDRPLVSERPGGEKRRHDVYLRYETQVHPAGWEGALPFAPGGRFALWARRADSADAFTTNVLLGAAPTQTTRSDIGLSVGMNLSSAWQLAVDAESSAQRSSNALLNLKNLSVYFHLRWGWRP